MRRRQVILEDARPMDKIRDTDNQTIHADLMMLLEVLLDMRDLLVKVRDNTR